MTATVNRIIELMQLEGDTASSLEQKSGLTTSSIAQWKKHRSNPSIDSLVKLCRYFNVSADYLLCLSDNPTPIKTNEIVKRQDMFLSTNLVTLSHEKRFVETAKMYMVLPDIYRERVYGIVQGIVIGLGFNIQNILEK